MMLVAYLVVLVIALPYRAAVGELLVISPRESAGGTRADHRVDRAVKVCFCQVPSHVTVRRGRQKAWQACVTLVQ
jgi:hypothetical protein